MLAAEILVLGCANTLCPILIFDNHITRYRAPNDSTEAPLALAARMIALIVFLEGTAHPDRQSPSIAPAGSTVCMVSCFDCWAGTMFLEQSQRSASSRWINQNGHTEPEPTPPPTSHALIHENTPLRPRRTTTGVAEPEPCPLGTYGNTTGLRKISDCNDCDPGSYCDQRGLTNPAGLCDPGYYCLDGSYTSAPNAPGSPLSIEDTDIGGLCPGELCGMAKGGARNTSICIHRKILVQVRLCFWRAAFNSRCRFTAYGPSFLPLSAIA